MTTIASFTLTSATTQAAAPFCIGHAFKQGDVPAGVQLVAGFSEFQVTPKNTWPDGSLKFALVAGRAALTANTPLTVTLSTGTPAAGTALTTADLKATGVQAAITTTAFGSASWASIDWDSPFQTWVSGPKMSSWIYRKQLSDPHLVAWLEVRLWSGGEVQVLPWVENGYLNVAAPASKTDTFTFTMDGVQRYSGTIQFMHHTRSVLINGTNLSYWKGTDPGVTPMHDKAYLKLTQMVPNYYASASDATVTGQFSTSGFAPMQQGDYKFSPSQIDDMTATGYSEPIGLLPGWDVKLITCSDAVHKTAYEVVIRNGYSSGRYPIHYRDETTNRIPLFATYPTLSIRTSGQGFKSAGGGGTYIPASDGISNTWDTAHSPATGFLPYLLTGRFYFMEEAQFAAATNYLGLGSAPALRDGVKGLVRPVYGAWQLRASAWMLRALAHAIAVTPDTDTAVRTQLVNSMQANIDYFKARYLDQPNNPLGYILNWDGYDTSTSKSQMLSPWQADFFNGALGYALSMGLPFDTGYQAKLLNFFVNYSAKATVHRLGPSDKFWYINAFPYNVLGSPGNNPDYVTGTGPWFASERAAYDATYATPPSFFGSTEGVLAPELANQPLSVVRSYLANMLPAISYAVQYAVPGAAEGYARLTGASNWAGYQPSFSTYPLWAVQPLSGTTSLTTPGPSTRIGARLLSSGTAIGTFNGLGITAAQMASGFTTDPIMKKHIKSGASAASEYLWEATDVPVGLSLAVYPDGSAIASAPDGSYSGNKIVYKDGVPDPGTYNFTFGAPPASTVTGVTVTPASATGSIDFDAIVAGTNNPSQAVTWDIVSGPGSINTATGTFAAPVPTGSVQTTIVRATSTQDPAQKGTATVTVAAATSTVTGVSVTPPTATGATSFAAVVAGTLSPSQVVNWTASAGQIDSAGNFTPPAATLVIQTITITATSAQNVNFSATAIVTIAAAVSLVTGVSVTPLSGTIAGSATRAHAAIVTGNGPFSTAVTWTTTLGAIDPDTGLLTAPAASGVDQFGTVTATSVQNPARSGSATFTIAAVGAAVPTVTSVDVTPQGGIISAQRQYAAVVNGTLSPDQSVLWTSSSGSITSAGLFTPPPPTYNVQLVTITATSVYDGQHSGTATVLIATIPGDIVVADNNMLRLDANGQILNTGANTFYTRGRAWWIDKDPDSEMFYGVDMASYLASAGAGIELVSVTGEVSGIGITADARIQANTFVMRAAGGLATFANPGAENFCTFHFTLSNGDTDDITIWFNITNR